MLFRKYKDKKKHRHRSMLQNIYNEINGLEKSKVKTNKIYNYDEYFRVFLWFALVFLMIDAVLRWRFFRIFN